MVAMGRGVGAAPGTASAGAALAGHHASLAGGLGEASAAGCLGLASSGLPVRDVLWNTSICTSEHQARSRSRQKESKPYAVAAPLLLPDSECRLPGRACSKRMDALFLVSSGRLSAVDAGGALKWAVQTPCSWRAADGEGLPSLSLLPQGAGAPPLVLAVGDRHAALVSAAAGHLLASTPLPSVPVAPPRIADFDNDGVPDVVVLARSGYYGLRTSLGTGSLAVQILFCFCGVAVVLTLVLRQQDAGAPAERERLHAS